MNYDQYGQAHCTSEEVCDLLYLNPDLDISNLMVDDPHLFNDAVHSLYPTFGKLKKYEQPDISSLEDFDEYNQSKWSMPKKYQELDIAQWVLDKCSTQEELQRVGEELLLYQERDLFNLLRQLKYIVDTWRKNNILWGVGRGSSVASYVLYLIGIHKINSIYYELDVHEFLR